MEPKISAVLLAAGLSRRMGKDKLLLPYRGKTLLSHAVELMAKLPVYEKILVTTASRLYMTDLPPGVRVVINPHPEDGKGGTIRLGVTAAAGDWYLFLQADQPMLGVADVGQLISAAGDNRNSIIYPEIGGKPCSPNLFPSRFREELLALTGDAGGGIVRAEHPGECIAIAPGSPENFFDVDDEEGYFRLLGMVGK